MDSEGAYKSNGLVQHIIFSCHSSLSYGNRQTELSKGLLHADDSVTLYESAANVVCLDVWTDRYNEANLYI
jgi:hypothetical protein